MVNETSIAAVIAAYFSKNAVAPSEIPQVMRTIRQEFAALEASVADVNFAEAPMGSVEPETGYDEGQVEQGQPARRLTAAEIRKSITPDWLYSFEDNRRYKTLRRPLARFGLTPETYREKWGLPDDYPMTAQSFSDNRSALAKKIGLGTRGRGAAPAPAPARRKTGGQPGNRNAAKGGRG